MAPRPIRPLDADVIGRIAAGEVVERPALAIKELVENSIDAGATAITVEIRDGGLTYFRVVDNGSGIPPADIRLAFARHATSKLRRADELNAIHTLGFRGEALASIAAVAKVTMTTRAKGEASGVRAVVSGGVMEPITEAASPEGTSITVRDLFYNTPARRKFLKKPQTEAGLVSDLVMRLILARPDIALRLSSGDRQVYHSPGNGSLRDALFSVLGRDALRSLVSVSGSAAGCRVDGFVGIGEAARSSRQMQTFILNGRFIRSTILSQALEEGCRERVMIGKHPICALQLTMPFESVDVNVHPNKLQVRFADEGALLAGIAQVIRRAFEAEPMKAAPRLTVRTDAAPLGAAKERLVQIAPQPLESLRAPVRLRDGGIAPPLLPRLVPDKPAAGGAGAAKGADHAEAGLIEPGAAQQKPPVAPAEQQRLSIPEITQAPLPLSILGVAWYEYVFIVMAETLYIIDQHAAHERILYEKFNAALDTQVQSQQLLVPQVVPLTHREHAALMLAQADLAAIGFDIEDFGDRSIQVRAVPMILGAPQTKAFFGELADRLGEYRALPTEEARRDMLVKYACRKAVKAGDMLPTEALRSLIEQMLSTGAPPTCPHGRPLVVAIDKAELDKRFRRIL